MLELWVTIFDVQKTHWSTRPRQQIARILPYEVFQESLMPNIIFYYNQYVEWLINTCINKEVTQVLIALHIINKLGTSTFLRKHGNDSH